MDLRQQTGNALMLEVRQCCLSTQQSKLIEQLSFTVKHQEIAGIQAPSGSGKSLLLRWILGALPEEISARGSLHLNGTDLSKTPTEKRCIGLMLQSAKLFPHLSVAGNLNIAIPSTLKGSERMSLIAQRLHRAGLDGYEKRDPSTLSGGEQARVALLRSLLAEPKALLLDEPFSSLDAATKQDFRSWVYAHIKELGIPTLIVSHDREDFSEVDWLIDIRKQSKTSIQQRESTPC